MNDMAVVEAVLFASDAPLQASEIARADEALDEDRVEAALAALKAEYDESGRAFELREVADGVQIMTRPEFAPYLERFDTVAKSARLSGPALEALAIVAYRQPVSRLDVEQIRGVNSAGVIRTLLAREMVGIVGRSEGVGRPVLYGTTAKFMEHFGFASMTELPRPEELPVVLRERNPQQELLLEASQLAEATAEETKAEEVKEEETEEETGPPKENAEAEASALGHSSEPGPTAKEP